MLAVATRIETASKRLTELANGTYHKPLEEILERVAADIGLRHISYIRFVSHSDRRLVDTVVTYSIDWQARYFEKNYYENDPVIAYGSTAVLPFDWDELKDGDPTVAAFFADAIAHDVGRNGISIPVRNRAGYFSLVSLTSDHASEDWIEYKRQNIAKLCLLATLIDSAASFTRKDPELLPKLSEQEKRCLTCFAREKNRTYIAESLGLAESDVELCLDTARHKLNCITVGQAVSIAIATKVLPPGNLH